MSETNTHRIGIETDLDKCIEVLAETKANCAYRIKNNICSDCNHCSTYRNFNASYAKLQPIDRLKLDNIAGNKYNELLVQMHRARTGKLKKIDYKRRDFRLIIVAFIIIIAVIYIFGGMAYFIPREVKYERYELERLYMVRDKLHEELYDLNRDGVINCQDYAVLFKVIWDREFPASAQRLRIAHNFNPGNGFNHLFVAYVGEHGTSYIEPQATGRDLSLESYWDNKYNPVYNNLAETQFWLWYMKVKS